MLGATLAVLDGSGYRGCTLDEVARRAGTTKPAIYRRWPTRQHLVLAALARRLGESPVPDTDCTLCDLAEGINVFVAAFQRMPPDVLGPLLADCAGEPELRTNLHDNPVRTAASRRRAHPQPRLARGDLREDVDRGLVLDLLGSLVHYRALFDHVRYRHVNRNSLRNTGVTDRSAVAEFDTRA
ncbi:MAG: TetR/AcrR family transcriptional regulator, partial [Pseudonocardiaceae bacterium]